VRNELYAFDVVVTGAIVKFSRIFEEVEMHF